MAERKIGTAMVAGALTGLGLNGIGAFIMNKVMPHGDAFRPVWHENTIGLSATSMAMMFIGLLLAGVLYVFDTESRSFTGLFLKFTAAWMILWAFIASFII